MRLSALVTTLLAATFLLLGAIQDNLESYWFPLLLAVVLCGLSALYLFSAFTRPAAASGIDGSRFDWAPLGPGIGLGIAYYLCLEWLGFYTASYLLFLAVTVLYDKTAPMTAKSVLIKALIAGLFIALLYGLFYHALHVQAPRGMFF